VDGTEEGRREEVQKEGGRLEEEQWEEGEPCHEEGRWEERQVVEQVGVQVCPPLRTGSKLRRCLLAEQEEQQVLKDLEALREF